MPVKNNKFSNFISSIEYIKDSVKKPFKKYFDEATSLYVSRKIEKKPTLLKIISLLKRSDTVDEAKKLLEQYTKYTPAIGIKQKATVFKPLPTGQKKDFHIQGAVQTKKQYRQKDGSYITYTENYKESKIISANNIDDAEKEYKEYLMNDYESYEDSYISGTLETVTVNSLVPVVSSVPQKELIERTRMKTVDNTNVQYDFFPEEKQFLNMNNKINFCVINNFVGIFETKMKMTEKRFIKLCQDYYDNVDEVEFDRKSSQKTDFGLDFGTDTVIEYAELNMWVPNAGVSPACLLWICQKLDISHYAFDVSNKCFLKYVSKSHNYEGLYYYAINEHMYLINDKHVKDSMSEKAKEQVHIKTSILENKLSSVNIFNEMPILTNPSLDLKNIQTIQESSVFLFPNNSDLNKEYKKIEKIKEVKIDNHQSVVVGKSIKSIVFKNGDVVIYVGIEMRDEWKPLEILENFNIADVTTLKRSSILMYTRIYSTSENNEVITKTRNDINKELEDVIKYHNIIPSKVQSTNYKVSSFKFTINKITFHCIIDSNKLCDLYTEHANYKSVKQLCKLNNIKFKNQTLVSYNKEKQTQMIENKNKRVVFSSEDRYALWMRDQKNCKSCKEPIDQFKFHIDHIVPLASFGTNNKNNLQCLCIPCHTLKTEVEKESGAYNQIDSQTQSAFNTDVQKIMNSDLYQARAFIEKMNHNEVPENKTVFHIDDNKCRTNLLRYGQYDFPKFSVMDTVEVYDQNKSNGTGIYFIESKNYLPLRGNGWYPKPMVDFCLKEKIITHGQIKFTIQASFEIPYDYFNDFIDHCYKNTPNVAKFSINSMIGSFNLNPTKNLHTTTIGIIQNNLESHLNLLKNKECFVNSFTVNNNKYFHLFKNNESNTLESESPIYNQIVHCEAIEMYKKVKLVEKFGGQVLDLNTDCVSCTFPDNILPFVLAQDGINLKAYFWDLNKTVLKYKIEMKDRLRFEKGAKSLRKELFTFEAKEWNHINDVKDNNFKPLVEAVLNNKSHLILGSGGCGKSTLIKEIQATLKENKKEFVTLCPTNKACLVIPDAMTLNKFKNKMNDKKYLININIDYIFVDEVSMMHEYFYKFLLTVKKFKPDVSFIISGDFKQLSPVNDQYQNENYENSPALFELCGGNRLVLTKCRRTDDKDFFDLCQGSMNLLNVEDFGNEQTEVNLVFTNKKRQEINRQMMENQKLKHSEQNHAIELINIKKKKNKNTNKIGLFIPKRNFDEQSQDVTLFVGMPVIARKNKKFENSSMANNEVFTISDIKKSTIELKNEISTIRVNFTTFQKYFFVAYAMTIHKSQGSTFNHPYTIHEWNRLDEKLKYVAISRTTKKEYINIII